MMMNPQRPAVRHPACLPSKSRGTVLFISLIVLVAMTLAGIAMMRSVATSNLIAGNLAFKQMTVQASDNGVEQAYQWLLANRATLNNTNAALGYYSSRPGAEPDWTDQSNWTNAITLPADAAGNVVSFLVHRMCTQPDTPYNGLNGGVANECAMSNASGGSSAGNSMAVDSPVYNGNSSLFYRVTALTQGPRGTYSVTQSVVRVSN
jgi:type IV pilus assembly protein PilX